MNQDEKQQNERDKASKLDAFDKKFDIAPKNPTVWQLLQGGQQINAFVTEMAKTNPTAYDDVHAHILKRQDGGKPEDWNWKIIADVALDQPFCDKVARIDGTRNDPKHAASIRKWEARVMAGWKMLPIPDDDPGVDMGGIVQFLASKMTATTNQAAEAGTTEIAFEQGVQQLIREHRNAKSGDKARTGPLAWRI